MHVPDGANELPQVVLSMPNTPLLVAMLLIVTVPSGLVLGLVTVTVLSPLVHGTLPNVERSRRKLQRGKRAGALQLDCTWTAFKGVSGVANDAQASR